MKTSAAKLFLSVAGILKGESAGPVPDWRPSLRKHKKTLVLSVTLSSCLILANPCISFDRYVGGTDDPYTTIQAAIDAANPEDSVIVRNGTYKGVGNTDIDLKGKAITVRSEWGPNACTIDGENARRGFVFHTSEGSESVVSGFTITRGRNVLGGGIYCNGASPTIINCKITGNIADDFGGAIYCFQSSASIRNCEVTSNHAGDDGGGIYLKESPATISNCNISSNHSTYWGAGIRSISSSPTITDCTISGNNGSNGGGISCSGGSPTISNCTITGNFGTNANGAGIYLTGSNAAITNCIIAKNTATYWGGGIRSISSSPVITNCTITQNKGSTGGGISCSGNYPTIVNSILWANTATKTGPQVYHSDSPSTPLITYSDVQGSYPGEGNINEDPLFSSLTDYRLQSSSPCIDAGTASGSPTDRYGVPRPQGKGSDMGAYEYASLIYVPDQLKTIQGGIDAVTPGGMVVVRDGTYTGDGNTNLDFKGKELTLRSEKGAANCTIDGEWQANRRGFVFHSGEGFKSIVSGFTIKRCSAYVPAGWGGGIFCAHSSPTITNCTITGNDSFLGGSGIYLQVSSATISNCIISNNYTAALGAGIFCESSSPSITNCIISENEGYAGGIGSVSSSPTITNCTITGNKTWAGVGGIYSALDFNHIIVNSILWGNEKGEVYYQDAQSAPLIAYSDVQGGYTGNTGKGNINSDPLFISPSTGNFRLKSTSPCINKGTSAGVPSTDMDGVARPQGGGYDMGAYEYKPGLDFLLLLLDE